MFTDLINYTDWANRLVIKSFLDADKLIPDAEKLFSHILNAAHIWISRIKKQEPKFAIFDLHPVDFFASFQDQCTQDLLTILEERDIKEEINYTSTKGGQFVNTIGDMLFQVVNHSTYHRAQIVTLFQINGIQPPVTDYVIMKWQEKI